MALKIVSVGLFATVAARSLESSQGPPCSKEAADSSTCNPAKQARTLLQYLGSTSGSVLAADEPAGIVEYTHDYIVSALLPQAEATTRELQAGLDNAVQAFESCSSALANEDSQLSKQESTLITAEQRHNECEMNVEKQNRSMDQICSDLQEYATNLEAPEEANAVNSSTPDAALATLATMSSFYNEVYPTFIEKKKACEVATNGEQVSAEQCAADKSAIEESWCGLRAARTQACSNLNSCYQAKSTSFDSAIEMTKLLEENTKKHVQKYIDSCKKKNDCSSGTTDLAKLAVSYPAKPSMLECDTTIKSDNDYSHVQCSGDDAASSTTDAEASASAPATAENTSSAPETQDASLSQALHTAKNESTAEEIQTNATKNESS